MLTCVTAGGTWEFVTMGTDEAGGRGCALLLDGQPVTSGDASPASVRRVMDAFLRAARVRETAAGRPQAPPAEPDFGAGGSAGPR